MNASNPRTALTTSASRLLALLTGEQKAAGCAPGTGRLRLLPLPGGIPDPGLPSGGRHPPGTGRPRFCPAVPGGLPHPERRRLPPRPADSGRSKGRGPLLLPGLPGAGGAAGGALSPAPVPAAAHQPAGRCAAPGTRFAVTLPGAEAPVSSLSSFYTLFYPFVGETHLGSESKVGFLSCMTGGEGRPWPDAVTGQGPGFSLPPPAAKGPLRFLTAQQFCKVFFLSFIFPRSFSIFSVFPS